MEDGIRKHATLDAMKQVINAWEAHGCDFEEESVKPEACAEFRFDIMLCVIYTSKVKMRIFARTSDLGCQFSVKMVANRSHWRHD